MLLKQLLEIKKIWASEVKVVLCYYKYVCSLIFNLEIPNEESYYQAVLLRIIDANILLEDIREGDRRAKLSEIDTTQRLSWDMEAIVIRRLISNWWELPELPRLDNYKFMKKMYKLMLLAMVLRIFKRLILVGIYCDTVLSMLDGSSIDYEKVGSMRLSVKGRKSLKNYLSRNISKVPGIEKTDKNKWYVLSNWNIFMLEYLYGKAKTRGFYYTNNEVGIDYKYINYKREYSNPAYAIMYASDEYATGYNYKDVEYNWAVQQDIGRKADQEYFGVLRVNKYIELDFMEKKMQDLEREKQRKRCVNMELRKKVYKAEMYDLVRMVRDVEQMNKNVCDDFKGYMRVIKLQNFIRGNVRTILEDKRISN